MNWKFNLNHSAFVEVNNCDTTHGSHFTGVGVKSILRRGRTKVMILTKTLFVKGYYQPDNDHLHITTQKSSK